MGALVSALPKRLNQERANTFSVIAFLILLIFMFGVRLLHFSPLNGEYLVSVATSLLLWCLVQQTRRGTDNTYSVLASFFSRISYTLYIVHLPLAIFLASAINSPWQRWSKTPGHLAAFAALDGLVLLCSYGLWNAFEANTDKVRLAIMDRFPSKVCKKS